VPCTHLYPIDRPVTLTALAEVKRASKNDSSTPSFKVIGRRRRIVEMSTVAK
jgi:hypothetical protein